MARRRATCHRFLVHPPMVCRAGLSRRSLDEDGSLVRRRVRSRIASGSNRPAMVTYLSSCVTCPHADEPVVVGALGRLAGLSVVASTKMEASRHAVALREGGNATHEQRLLPSLYPNSTLCFHACHMIGVARHFFRADPLGLRFSLGRAC
jgi:hypothetical protein